MIWLIEIGDGVNWIGVYDFWRLAYRQAFWFITPGRPAPRIRAVPKKGGLMINFPRYMIIKALCSEMKGLRRCTAL